MGGKDSTVTNKTTPPPEIMEAYKSLISRAQGVANTPYKPYTGDLVAPINSTQQSAFNTVNNLGNVQNPYLQQAQNYMNQSTGSIWDSAPQVNSNTINSFMSPYQQDVTNATMANINETNAQQQTQLQGNAISQGAWGGDRAGVAAAELARQQGLASNQTLANLNNQNYSQALGAAQQQQQAGINASEAQKALQAQAGFGTASLGSQALQGQLAGANAQLQTGGLQQQQSQNELNTSYQQWLNQQQYPFQTTQWLGNLVEGAGAGMGGSSSTTTPGPSGLSQAAGAVQTIAPLLMMAFAKDGGAIKGYADGGSANDDPNSLNALLGSISNLQKQQATTQSQSSPLSQAVTQGWAPQFVAAPTPVLGPGANLAQSRSYARGGSTDDSDPNNDFDSDHPLAHPMDVQSIVPPGSMISVHSTLPAPPPPPKKDDSKSGGMGGMPDPMSMMGMMGGMGSMGGASSAGSFLDAGTAADGMAAFAKNGGAVSGDSSSPYSLSTPLTSRPVTMQSIVPMLNGANGGGGGSSLPKPPDAAPQQQPMGGAGGGMSSIDPKMIQQLSDQIKADGNQPGAIGRSEGFGDGPTDKVWVTPSVNASTTDVIGNNLSNLYGAQGGNTGAGADFMSWLGMLRGGSVKGYADGGDAYAGDGVDPVTLGSIVPASQAPNIQPGSTLPAPPQAAPAGADAGIDPSMLMGSGSGGGGGGGADPAASGGGDSWFDKWAASPLTQMGLATLSGTSPYAGVNIGRGALAGIQAVAAQKQSGIKNEELQQAILEKRLANAKAMRQEQYYADNPYPGSPQATANALSKEADGVAQQHAAATAPDNQAPAQAAPAQQSAAVPPILDPRDLVAQYKYWSGAAAAGDEHAATMASSALSALKGVSAPSYIGVDGQLHTNEGFVAAEADEAGQKKAAEEKASAPFNPISLGPNSTLIDRATKRPIAHGTSVGADANTPAQVPDDANSASILAQTGLSMNGFMYLTGRASQLPRDQATRNKAAKEAETFANSHGVDVSTFAAQYKAYNDVVTSNVLRNNNTKIMEDEMLGTIKNLKPVADAAKLGALRPENLARVWAGQETNDPVLTQYGFQLQQLRTELAAYSAATQGRNGNSITQQDYAEAEHIIKNGLSSKAADGLGKSVDQATTKMRGVMENAIRSTNKAVWNLFGVGGNYDKVHGDGSVAVPSSKSAYDALPKGAHYRKPGDPEGAVRVKQ